jgi:hypothetical protein
MNFRKLFFLALVALLISSGAFAQIPVEFFGGHEKTTVDITGVY